MYRIDRRSTSGTPLRHRRIAPVRECRSVGSPRTIVWAGGRGGACTFEPGGWVMSAPPAPFPCRSGRSRDRERRGLRRRAVHVAPPVPEHVVALADALVARVDKIQ